MLHQLLASDLDSAPSAEAMLDILPGPSCLRVPGRDRSRCRVVSTLLHGNEPSGVRAIHAYLGLGTPPAVDLICFFGAVEAARHLPRFSHRFLPGERDLNRCFREPFLGREGAVARAFLEELERLTPDALIDLHNTSGRGPAYAVASSPLPKHRSLATLFTERLIVTDLRLGALTEASSQKTASIVVECGGAGDAAADRVAIEGLRRFADKENLSSLRPPGDVLEHPVRLELTNAGTIAYADQPDAAFDVVIDPDLDRFNFGTVPTGQPLGWVGSRELEVLQLRTGAGTQSAEGMLSVKNRRLYAARRFRPLMITTQASIASSDCLLYAVLER